MIRTSILIKICLALCAVTFLLTIGDFLAIHDIRHDYISKEVIENHTDISQVNLPAWSETTGEWQMVEISGLVRAVYFGFSAITLLICLKGLKNRAD